MVSESVTVDTSNITNDSIIGKVASKSVPDYEYPAADLFRIRAVAEESARRAGKFIASNQYKFGQDFSNVEAKYNNRDLVTAIDKEAENIIRSCVADCFPASHATSDSSVCTEDFSYSFLGEEDVSMNYGSDSHATMRAIEDFLSESNTAKYKWICDPLDGTANFVSDIPLYCVAISVADTKGNVLVAITYDPLRDEMFSAVAGHGFTLNAKLKTARTRTLSLSEAFCGCNFHAHPQRRIESVAAIQKMEQHVRSQRILGTSALSLAWVAAGRFDMWWGNSLNCWDLAAGSLLVKEAKGVVSDVHDQPFKLQTHTMIASATQDLHDEAIVKLRPVLDIMERESEDFE